MVLDNGDIGVYDNFGKPYEDNVLDIVSEWHEEINEEKLDELASKIYPYDEDNIPLQGIYMCNLRNIWKAGYRKAKRASAHEKTNTVRTIRLLAFQNRP